MKCKIIATVLNIFVMLIVAILIRPVYTVEASEVIQISTGEEFISAIRGARRDDIIIQLANDIEMGTMGWDDKPAGQRFIEEVRSCAAQIHCSFSVVTI